MVDQEEKVKIRRFKSSGMFHCVDWWIASDVVKIVVASSSSSNSPKQVVILLLIVFFNCLTLKMAL